MVFVVEHDGMQSVFPDDSLLVFIDETGDEKLGDSNVPYFGFGGCMCRAGDYTDLIVKPWRRVEQKFGSNQLPLHAAELRSPSSVQIEVITSFFNSGRFFRFATVIKKDVLNDSGCNPFHIAARVTFDRIIELIQRRGEDFSQIVMLFEHSQRLDRHYADYFQRYHFTRRDGQKVPVFRATQTKAAGAEFSPGLVVADFVAHTAGSMSRSTIGGKLRRNRRDFDAVFQHELASHLFIDAVRVRLGTVFPTGN